MECQAGYVREKGQIKRAMIVSIDIFSIAEGMKGSLLQGFEELMIVLYGTLCKYSLIIKVRRVMACDGIMKQPRNEW